jgi:hypothetical protein
MQSVHSPLAGGNKIVRAELIGSSTRTSAGLTVRGNVPALAICRKLIAAGHDPDCAFEVYRNGVLSLRIRSIAAGAGIDVQDDNRGVPRFTRHRPRPDKAGRLALAEVRQCASASQECNGEHDNALYDYCGTHDEEERYRDAHYVTFKTAEVR